MSANDPHVSRGAATDDTAYLSPKERPELLRKRARVFFFELLWKWFIAVVLTVLLVLVVIDTLQGREVREELVSCGVENGECYERTQERLENAISDIYEQGVDREQITRQIIVIAASCSGDESTRTIEAIERCVNARLAAENRVDVEEGNR